MDYLGIRRAALLGISMGGMIAQEFAINYPERLSSLILGCTHFGGREIVAAAQEVVAAIVAGEKATAEMKRLQERAVFGPKTIEQRSPVIEKNNEARSRYPIPQFAFARQVAAVGASDASTRLGTIRTPTMVIAGQDDMLVPPENSRRIAARIPGAVLKEMAGGHLFFAEYPEEFNRSVIEFVKAHA